MEHGKREQAPQPSRAPARQTRKPRNRRRFSLLRFIGHIFLAIFTVVLIGVCTTAIFGVIFLRYIETSVAPTLAISLSDYTQSRSSIIYYYDETVTENDGWVEYQTIHGVEDRIPVKFSDIPDAMWQAAVAIEDKRFFTHQGVDWIRTAGAIKTFFTNDSQYGASTITQQVLKNITQDNKPYINRKLREIFRALEFEQNTSKQQILEEYLNAIYLGGGCKGVQTAAQFYFGKDVNELSLAECASIIAITNNPSIYGPMSTIVMTREDGTQTTGRERNKARQELILDTMASEDVINPDTGLPYLTQAQADAAKAEVLHFTDGSTDADEIVAQANSGVEINNWFVEHVLDDVANALMEKYEVSKDYALSMINTNGYNIYTTMDPNIQEIAESVYRDRSNLDITSPDGTQQIQSGITIVDVTTGNVVASVGAIGPKEGNRVTNFATMRNQVGSSIKPLTCYAPALDAGVVSPASTFDNYPVQLFEGSPWPKNSPNTYTGWTTVRQGIISSINTIAVQTLQAVGLAESYAFATEKLGLSLVTADMALSPLGMGGLTYGVSTEQMAAAFAAFANGGIYNSPRTFLRVEDPDGNIILENESDTHMAMKDTTAYLMTSILQTAVSSGTGTDARFSGMSIAGKTGTTNNNYTRYFAGYTPYYSAAVWVGYQKNAKIVYNVNGRSPNPAAEMWRKVMEQVHADLPNRSFDQPAGGLTTVQVCADSGMIATDACRADLRGSRVISVTIASGTGPTEPCTLHTMVDYCTEGQCLAGEFCPEESVKQVGVLDYEREDYGPSISASDDAYLLVNLQKAIGATEENPGSCPVHTTAPPDDPNADPSTGTDPGGTIPGTDPSVTDPIQPNDPSVDPGTQTPVPSEPDLPTVTEPPVVPVDPDDTWGILAPPPA